MSRTVHHAVIKDSGGVPRLTATRVRRTREDGLHVESLVYASADRDQKDVEPVAEWVLPVQLRYDLDEAAKLAVAQTRFNESTRKV